MWLEIHKTPHRELKTDAKEMVMALTEVSLRTLSPSVL